MKEQIVALAIVMVVAICAIVPTVESCGNQKKKGDFAMTPENCMTCHSWNTTIDGPHHVAPVDGCLNCHCDPPLFESRRHCLLCHDVKWEHHRLGHGPKDCATCHGTQS